MSARPMTSAQRFALDALAQQGLGGTIRIGGYYGVNRRTAAVLVRYGICQYVEVDGVECLGFSDGLTTVTPAKPPQNPGSVGHLRQLLEQFPDDMQVHMARDLSDYLAGKGADWRGYIVTADAMAKRVVIEADHNGFCLDCGSYS